jgi:hypothetical protein
VTDAKALAASWFAHLQRQDAPAALSLCGADASIDIVPAQIRGNAHGEGTAFVQGLVRAFPDLLFHVRSLTGTATLAIAEVTMEGTQAADFLGVLNQEKHVDLDQAWMFWARDQRLSAVRAYWCQNQLYRRLAVKRLDRISILDCMDANR